MSRSKVLAALGAAIALAFTAPAFAQTTLKWAHVYETPEPYHQQALWAAEEIKKRTNGRFVTLQLKPERNSPSDAAAFIARETQKWADVIRKAGVKPH